MNHAIILASGEGKRFGSRKQYSLLDGEELYIIVLKKLLGSSVSTITLVVNNDQVDLINDKMNQFSTNKTISVVSGGSERFDSVINGINYIRSTNSITDEDKVIILESARPKITTDQINNLLDLVTEDHPSVTYGLSVNNAILDIDKSEYLIRESLASIQTPQAFMLKTIISSIDKYNNRSDKYYAYEECQVVLKELGISPLIVPGSNNLLKITRLNDMESMRNLSESKVVLITGGSGALGGGLVKYFTDHNYKVIAPSHSELDLSLPSLEFNIAIKNYLDSIGNPKIDILINNAGIMKMNSFIHNDFFNEYYEMMNVNLNNPLYLTQYILKNNSKAIIINISSTSGEFGRPKFMGYGISKSGMMIMTESLVSEGYTSFCINPGRLKSKLRSNYFGNEDIKDLLEPHHISKVVENIINNHYPNGTMLSVRVDDGVFKVKDITRI